MQCSVYHFLYFQFPNMWVYFLLFIKDVLCDPFISPSFLEMTVHIRLLRDAHCSHTGESISCKHHFRICYQCLAGHTLLRKSHFRTHPISTLVNDLSLYPFLLISQYEVHVRRDCKCISV